MSDWITSTINGAFGLLGNEQQFASSKKLMQKQHHYNKKYAEYVGSNAHQWTVKDLQAAGLNPVLSATQGANATSGGNVGLPSAPDYAGSLQSAVQTYMDNKRLENETTNTKSTTELNEATAKNQEAQANKTKKESGWIDSKSDADIKHMNSATAVNNAKKEEIASKIELEKAEKELKIAQKIGQEGHPHYLLRKAQKWAEVQGENYFNSAQTKKDIDKKLKDWEKEMRKKGYYIPNLSY